MISFDVSSLYTNVPVQEAIEYCADLLYNLPPDKLPPVDKETFILLTMMASCDVIMLTHDGFYKQVDGLAMGSPPAPHLANGWLSQFEAEIRGNAKFYERYMDDILREIKEIRTKPKLQEINNLHKNLQFTSELEQQASPSDPGILPFLSMSVIHDHESGVLTSTWYNKPTDTGLIMNYHALAPKRYKRSVVSGFVYRIHQSCSTWENFHLSLERAKRILEQNQYPPTFYETIIRDTLEKIFTAESKENESTSKSPSPAKSEKFLLKVQYRGRCTDDYARALHKAQAPCTVVMTLRKLKTVLPSLKEPVEKMFKSGVVYKIVCPSCTAMSVKQPDICKSDSTNMFNEQAL